MGQTIVSIPATKVLFCKPGERAYPDECRHTAKLLAEALNLTEDEYVVSFQSQFGRAKWITPSTQDLFNKLPKQGVTELDVFCPGFLADCLETM